MAEIDPPNRAVQELRKRFLKRGAQQDLARASGLSQSLLSRLVAENGPDPGMGTVRTLAEHGVKPQWWFEPPRWPKPRPRKEPGK